jgi:hypothetical protein
MDETTTTVELTYPDGTVVAARVVGTDRQDWEDEICPAMAAGACITGLTQHRIFSS